jgi:hypothetical protein
VNSQLLLAAGEIQSEAEMFMEFVIHVIARMVVPLFFVGMAGSAVVIAISFIGDLKELVGDED